jgi:hypothetical protein
MDAAPSGQRKLLQVGDVIAVRLSGESGIQARHQRNLRAIPLYGIGDCASDYIDNANYEGQLKKAAPFISLVPTGWQSYSKLEERPWANPITIGVGGMVTRERHEARLAEGETRQRFEESATYENGEFLLCQQLREYVVFKWSSTTPIRTLLDVALRTLAQGEENATSYVTFGDGRVVEGSGEKVSNAIARSLRRPMSVRLVAGDEVFGWVARIGKVGNTNVPLNQCAYAVKHAMAENVLSRLITETATPSLGRDVDTLVEDFEHLTKPYR